MTSPGANPTCLRCKKGASYHGGHNRADPLCILHGCLREDAKGIQEFLRQKKIDAALRDSDSQGERPSTAPKPLPVDPGAHPKPTKLCLRCIKGEKSHHRHEPTADNCILFGVEQPTAAKARELRLQQDIQMARDEARTATAMSSTTSTSPPLPSPPPPPPPRQAKKRRKHRLEATGGHSL